MERDSRGSGQSEVVALITSGVTPGIRNGKEQASANKKTRHIKKAVY